MQSRATARKMKVLHGDGAPRHGQHAPAVPRKKRQWTSPPGLVCRGSRRAGQAPGEALIEAIRRAARRRRPPAAPGWPACAAPSNAPGGAREAPPWLATRHRHDASRRRAPPGGRRRCRRASRCRPAGRRSPRWQPPHLRRCTAGSVHGPGPRCGPARADGTQQPRRHGSTIASAPSGADLCRHRPARRQRGVVVGGARVPREHHRARPRGGRAQQRERRVSAHRRPAHGELVDAAFVELAQDGGAYPSMDGGDGGAARPQPQKSGRSSGIGRRGRRPGHPTSRHRAGTRAGSPARDPHRCRGRPAGHRATLADAAGRGQLARLGWPGSPRGWPLDGGARVLLDVAQLEDLARRDQGDGPPGAPRTGGPADAVQVLVGVVGTS